jgi:hypothetical protein
VCKSNVTADAPDAAARPARGQIPASVRTKISFVAAHQSSMSTSPRLAVVALSAGSQRHVEMRCFFRTAILAFAEPSEARVHQPLLANWLALNDGGGSILLRFVVPATADTKSEHELHGDLLRLTHEAVPANCAARVLLGFRKLVLDLSRRTIDFYMVTDDDVWLSPPRLMNDLRAMLGQQQYHIVYGTMAFAAGWSDSKLTHYGWAPLVGIEDHLPRFLRGAFARRRRQEKGLGPFPFPMGYYAVFSAGLALSLAESAALDALVARLVVSSKRRRPEPWLKPGKCYPGADVSLGYLMSAMAPTAPLVAIDTTYANRALPFAGASAARELTRRAAVLHNASSWSDHFRWAT